MPPPDWRTLTQEQREFLLEAFQLDSSTRQTFADIVPDELKQNLLNSLWSVLTPEKRVQIALYSHIEKPWSAQSEATARAQAPQYSKLSKLQKFHLFEAAHWDATQRGIFENLPNELRQSIFETLWSYLDPKVRKKILFP